MTASGNSTGLVDCRKWAARTKIPSLTRLEFTGRSGAGAGAAGEQLAPVHLHGAGCGWEGELGRLTSETLISMRSAESGGVCHPFGNPPHWAAYRPLLAASTSRHTAPSTAMRRANFVAVWEMVCKVSSERSSE